MDPSRIRDLADDVQREAAAALESGDNVRALILYKRAQWLLEWESDERRRLTGVNRSPSVLAMNAAHREAISKGHSVSPPMKAARRAGMQTMREVAKALGVSKAFVSMVFNGHKRWPAEMAAKFEKLTGYKA